MSYYSSNRQMGFNYGQSYETDYSSKSNKKNNSRYWDSDSYYGNDWGSSWGGWGNFGFGGFNVTEDNDDLIIKNNESYLTPTASELINRISGKVNSSENRKLIKEMSRFFYHKMIDEKNYFDDKYENLEALSEDEITTYNEKKVFYDELWDKWVPGFSPLEKALSVFTEITKKNGEKEKYVNDGSLEKTANGLTFDAEIYMNPIFNELLDENAYGKKFKTEILNKLSMIAKFGSEFKVEKEITEKIVTHSHIHALKIMRDYSQMHQLELYQRLMPTFNIKLLTKDLIVNVPVDRTEHKQKIIILVDYSGSMNEHAKQQWVTAIMIDRLRYAIKEEAEIFFSFFVDEPDELWFTHIYNKETAMAFWKTFSNSPNGGDTAVGSMIERIKEEVESKSFFDTGVDLSEDKPEVLVINDGNDSVKTSSFVYKTNAIALLQGNNQLQDLCIKNKGKFIKAMPTYVETHSTTGMQKLTY